MSSDRTASAATKRVWKHGPAEGTTGWHGRLNVGRLADTYNAEATERVAAALGAEVDDV